MADDGSRKSLWASARHLAGRTPPERNRYVDFLRALSIAAVVVGHWLIAAPHVDGFSACLTSGRFRGDIAKDLQEGQSFGVRGTPAFFVNGRFLSGNQPYEALAKIVDEELEATATR